MSTPVSIQERLQMKRVPLDNWSVREQLCLASAVLCSGDQNWMSVSRSLKILCDSKRPPDWFSQKSCAAQYGKLLENVETPKRKKRTLSERDSSTPVETPGESIVRKLTQERIMELKQTMIQEQQEFHKLKDDILSIQSDEANEAQIRHMWAEIEEEERQKEIEKANHDEWLKKREQRKLEMERAWRPGLAFHGTKSPQKAAQLKQQTKVEEGDAEEGSRSSGQSPLLTSLLKSPSTSTSSSSLLQAQTTPTSSRNIPGNHPVITSSSNTFDLTNSPSLITAPQSSSSSQITSTTSASQQAPTLSMLLDTKHAHKPSVKTSTEQISTSTAVDSPQPDLVSEIFPEQISSVESGDAQNDDQLMEVFKGLIPDNIEELADILTDDNNEIIPELLEEEEILENALIEEEESNPEPKLDAFDQLKNETIREERKKKELAAQQQLEMQLQQQQKEIKVDENMPITISPEDSNQEDDLPLKVIQKDMLEAHKLKEQQDPLSTMVFPSSSSSSFNSNDAVVVVTEDPKDIFTVVSQTQQPTTEPTFHPTSAPSTKNEEPAPAEQQGAVESVSTTQPEVKSEVTEEPMEIEFEGGKELPKLIEIKEEFNESANESSTTVDKKNLSDDDIFEDAKEEISNEPIPTQQILQVLDTDDDSVTETLIKDEKSSSSGGRARRDYTRKQKHDEAQIRSEDSDSRSSSMATRTRSKEHERSESPMIYDEDSDNTPRRTRRFSSTPVIDSVPGSPASGIDDKEHKAWRKLILLAYGRIAAHRYAEVFRILKDEDYERKYKKAVLKPIDLTSIKKNIENGQIRTTADFQRSIMQFCMNIMMISPKNSTNYNQAREMMVESVATIRHTIEEMKESSKEADRSLSTSLTSTSHTTRKASRKSQRV